MAVATDRRMDNLFLAAEISGFMVEIGKKDVATVNAHGERLESLIDGVVVRYAVTQTDERGDLTEIYDVQRGVTQDPLVYVYATSIRPGRRKGWVYHRLQTDRLFALSGFLKIVLYDLREDSPTRGQINEIHLSERKRGLVVIPPLVAHAVENSGNIEANFINLPNRPYRHDDPDKYRVPEAEIPYDFECGRAR